jgi:hypothetical protein
MSVSYWRRAAACVVNVYVAQSNFELLLFMTVHLVTFSDESMSRAADLCIESAKRHGADEAWHYEKRHVWTSSIVRENQALFDLPRGGGGCFAWKPLIIQDAMRRAEECYSGDQYIIYSDAGVEFVDNQKYIIDRMDQDVFVFGNMWEHAHWCKRDVINAICPERYLIEHGHKWAGDVCVDQNGVTWGSFGKQAQASVIFFRVSDYSRKFVREWLDWCLFEGGRLVDDSPSRAPNHPEFQENRWDQAILTTLAYREGIRLHWWPSIYNWFVPGGPVFTYEKGDYKDDYPALYHHHRLRDHEWSNVA